MIPFKFLDDNEDDILEGSDNGASWVFIRVHNLIQYNYDTFTDYHYGIGSFLRNFPNNTIACVISITGPNGIIHNADNQGMGWGFDITSELIGITWCRFRNDAI
jgi:hypothetical protein